MEIILPAWPNGFSDHKTQLCVTCVTSLFLLHYSQTIHSWFSKTSVHETAYISLLIFLSGQANLIGASQKQSRMAQTLVALCPAQSQSLCSHFHIEFQSPSYSGLIFLSTKLLPALLKSNKYFFQNGFWWIKRVGHQNLPKGTRVGRGGWNLQ